MRFEENENLLVDASLASQISVPSHFGCGDYFQIRASGGPADLLLKLAAEAVQGELSNDPLTGDDIARLIELFQDEPLPVALREILVRHHRGERKFRAGRKMQRSPLTILTDAMLPQLYGMAKHFAEQRHSGTEMRNSWSTHKAILNEEPSKTHLTCQQLREWIPRLRHVSDKRILNMISEAKKFWA